MAEIDIPSDETVPEETKEVVKQEEHIPSTEERQEHMYDELRNIRAELAELRAHSHSELAHATHEHEQYSGHDHTHEIPHSDADRTEEPSKEHSSGITESAPSSVHPWFRKIGR